MSGPGPAIVLGAGALTFVGEWYWNKEIDWKVPLATVLLAGGVEILSSVDRNGATILSLMVAAGALSTKFNGHSAFQILTGVINTTGKAATGKQVTKVS
jgi:hypothetical protein